jgi:Membrane domain of glycerophosphoryl diester phosphodiesterase
VVKAVVAEVWRLFIARFWRTLLIVGLALAPLELALALLDPTFSSRDGAAWWLWVLASSSLTLVALPWMIGAVIHDVAEGDRSGTNPYLETSARLPDLVLSALVTTVGILLGTIAFLVPGLILMARWAIVVPLIVLEGLSWRAALSRSNELVKGLTGQVLAIFAVLTVVALGLIAIPLVVGYVLLGGVLGAWVAAMAINTAFIAFYSFAPFVLYRRLTTQRLQSEPRCGVV